MYKFVKLKDNRTNLEYPWIFKCTNMMELIVHTEKYMGNEIESGIKDFFHRHEMHANTNWRGAVESLGKIKGGVTFVEQSLELENEVLNGKRELLESHGCIYLRSNGSYMVHSDEFETLEEIVMNKMVYPQYSKSDIRIVQWPNGTHYYAKLGNMDVVDGEGNQKWDSHDEAYQAAMKELKS